MARKRCGRPVRKLCASSLRNNALGARIASPIIQPSIGAGPGIRRGLNSICAEWARRYSLTSILNEVVLKTSTGNRMANRRPYQAEDEYCRRHNTESGRKMAMAAIVRQ
jgi:hypothetical protein